MITTCDTYYNFLHAQKTIFKWNREIPRPQNLPET